MDILSFSPNFSRRSIFFYIISSIIICQCQEEFTTEDWCNFESVFHGSVEKLLIRRIMIMNFISLRRISVTRVRGRMMEIVLVSLGENFKDTERKMSEGENEKRDLSNGEIFQRQFSNGEFFFSIQLFV